MNRIPPQQRSSRAEVGRRVAGLIGLSSAIAAGGYIVGHSTGSTGAIADVESDATALTPTTAASTTSTIGVTTTTAVDITTGVEPTVAESVVGAGDGSCSNPYEVASGDSWTWIAQEASIGVDQLYALNQATAETMLYPGDIVCIPEGNFVVQATPPTAATAAGSSTASSSGSSSNSATTTTARTTPPQPSADTTSHGS